MQARTIAARNQGSLNLCDHALCSGRRVDRRLLFLKAAVGTVICVSQSSISAMLLEDKLDAGNSWGTSFVLVKVSNCLLATNSGFSSTVMLLENMRDACRCSPCFVFSQ